MGEPIPRFSVIVPAYRAAAHLADTLPALKASTVAPELWELVVVDDASPDDTALVARAHADQVISLPGPSGGPSRARNAGAKVARGEWLIFIDADVRVHPDTLRRFVETIGRKPELAAIFGSYDATPAAKGLVSEYRNLLHRYVHQRGAGPASTFWAGCGAMRRDWFESLGGFDETRYPRQLEDLELGLRLHDRGGAIELDPALQATHLKRWTMPSMMKADVLGRGLTWMRIMMERPGRAPRSLNVEGAEPIKVALAGIALAALPASVVFRDPRLLLLIPGIALMLTAWNLVVYRWFARERGAGFAAAVIPLHLLYYAGNAVAAFVGLLLYGWRGLMTRSGARGQAVERATPPGPSEDIIHSSAIPRRRESQ